MLYFIRELIVMTQQRNNDFSTETRDYIAGGSHWVHETLQNDAQFAVLLGSWHSKFSTLRLLGLFSFGFWFSFRFSFSFAIITMLLAFLCLQQWVVSIDALLQEVRCLAASQSTVDSHTLRSSSRLVIGRRMTRLDLFTTTWARADAVVGYGYCVSLNERVW